MTADLFGREPAKPEFRDIRNTRPTKAEEKATLLLHLGALINRAPVSVRDGSVDITRRWLNERKRGAKIAGSPRSSAQELQSAINALEGFKRPLIHHMAHVRPSRPGHPEPDAGPPTNVPSRHPLQENV